MRQFSPFFANLVVVAVATRLFCTPAARPLHNPLTHSFWRTHSSPWLFIYLFLFRARFSLRAPCFANYNYNAEGDVSARQPRLFAFDALNRSLSRSVRSKKKLVII